MQNEALYRSLYSKYAPNLTAGELEKKLKYAYTLDPNEFINAFYKKYTGGPPTAKQSKYISTVIDTKSRKEETIDDFKHDPSTRYQFLLQKEEIIGIDDNKKPIKSKFGFNFTFRNDCKK